jgi:molybdopterin-biosynthesis enzyme MoeA-like protein
VRIGLLIIGDELLSGKRRDKHLPAMIERLAARGLRLGWARLVGDDAALLEATLRETLASGDLVLSFGGIGATPDDLTRQCAARAAAVDLERHPQAVRLIEERFGETARPNRILMADLPAGAQLIPNPVSGIPGFSLGNHHFLPGFPSMAWPMAEWILDTRYRHLHHREGEVEQGVTVHGVAESTLVPLLREVLARFPDVRVSSLPSTRAPGRIELGVRGPPDAASRAFAHLVAGLDAMGVRRG